jgi:hypothetical protein
MEGNLGGDDVTTPSARTADQTEIALFWSETPPKGTELQEPFPLTRD